jgi:quinoprotein glucose dehydrogenase
MGRGYLVPVVVWLGSACASGPAMETAGPGPESSAPETVWAGVYSGSQAQRGASAYAEACSSCHAEDLRGNSNAPSLVGASFLFLWEDRSLNELFTVIRTEMPTNAPNSLPATTYVDILAFVLEANGFPPGAAELGPEPGLLESIAITGRAPH